MQVWAVTVAERTTSTLNSTPGTYYRMCESGVDTFTSKAEKNQTFDHVTLNLFQNLFGLVLLC